MLGNKADRSIDRDKGVQVPSLKRAYEHNKKK